MFGKRSIRHGSCLAAPVEPAERLLSSCEHDRTVIFRADGRVRGNLSLAELTIRTMKRRIFFLLSTWVFASACTAPADHAPSENKMSLLLASTAFTEGGEIPSRYTCE